MLLFLLFAGCRFDITFGEVVRAGYLFCTSSKVKWLNMNLKGLLHSESRVVLGLSRKQSIEENSGDANNDKHSLHRLPLGKGKHIKKLRCNITLFFNQGPA